MLRRIVGEDTKMDLLKSAKELASRVEAEALRTKLPVSVSVVDIHGNIVLKYRMNGALAFSMGISERKAYTSALIGVRIAGAAWTAALRTYVPKPILRDGWRSTAPM